MKPIKPKIFLWEFAISPHLGNILIGMAELGFSAKYVVKERHYSERKGQGWTDPELPNVEIISARSKQEIARLINSSSRSDIHICAGIRGNSFINEVVSELRRHRRKFIVFSEPVEDHGKLGILKRFIYRRLLQKNEHLIETILSTSPDTGNWIASLGVRGISALPFAYFLQPYQFGSRVSTSNESFRLLFVGSLIPRKRPHLVIKALSELPKDVTVDIVGDGPMRDELEGIAATLPDRVFFHGTQRMSDIHSFMLRSDCLVLPSLFDGWGAVISEAMICGTPVICSDNCGASMVVEASGNGAVFPTFSEARCFEAINAQVTKGPISASHRNELSDWATCLTYTAGASYLERVITALRSGGALPEAPWNQRIAGSAAPASIGRG